MFDNIAVCVRNVQKNYGPIEILRKICITVERGTIYGLLGPSGCGKTTLLNCIVGRSKIDDGDIWFLGKKAGDSPGSQVGYMPQNTALINDFTVKEVIYFFGKIYDMDCYVLRNRFNKLKRMLDLPPDNRIISKCSGGQQRRVSLAVALIHDPELLILDEPSVGADPILRDRIWTYLYQLVYEARITVIITTHYIEEAKQANRIGLMRGGKLLVEDSPARLMRTYNCSTLEDIFFILSERQEEKTGSKIMIAENESWVQSSSDSTENLDFHASSDKILPERKSRKPNNSFVSMNRVKVLLRKNVKLIQRNIIGTCVLITMPFIQMLLFMLAVGREVHDIPIAVVNDEVRNFSCSDISWNNTVLYQNDICHLEHISCRFLDNLKHPVMQLKSYDSTKKAIDDIRKGKLTGVIHIASNLSEKFQIRLTEEAEVEVTAQADIEVFLDMADIQIGNTLRSRLSDMYLNFQTSIFNDCNVSQLGRPPIAFLEYYYGHKDDQLIVFMAPGLSMTLWIVWSNFPNNQEKIRNLVTRKNAETCLYYNFIIFMRASP